MKVTIPDAKKLTEGVWMAEMSEGELQLIPGRAPEGGGKNIVVINAPEFSSDGKLSFALMEARLANRAANQPTVFLEQTRAAVAPKTGEENKDGRQRAAKIFWVSVAAQFQENLHLGLRAKVWGVKNEYARQLDVVAQGDFALFYAKNVGFTLCRIESAPYFDTTPIWSDGIYPNRVKISDPILTESKIGYADVSGCLLDKKGLRYINAQAANRGISSYGGTFRWLSPSEAQQIFSRLGWRYEVTTVASP
jgi:hypothetical protein